MSEKSNIKVFAADHEAAHGEAESLILQAVRGIRYGSVEVVIHNGKVVQVERREKLRLTT